MVDAYCWPGTVLNTLYVLTDIILNNPMGVNYQYYSYFAHEDTGRVVRVTPLKVTSKEWKSPGSCSGIHYHGIFLRTQPRCHLFPEAFSLPAPGQELAVGFHVLCT